MINIIGVIGAGTMGSGIAQTAAQSGYNTLLFDINLSVLEQAKVAIQKNLQYLADKQKLTQADKQTIYERIQFISDISSITLIVICSIYCTIRMAMIIISSIITH